MRSPVNWACIRGATVRGILDPRKGAAQKLLRCRSIITTTGKVVLIGVESAAKPACPRRRRRQKQVCIFRVLKIGLAKEGNVFVRSHPEIVRSSKGGHFSLYTKKNLLRLRR